MPARIATLHRDRARSLLSAADRAPVDAAGRPSPNGERKCLTPTDRRHGTRTRSPTHREVCCPSRRGCSCASSATPVRTPRRSGTRQWSTDIPASSRRCPTSGFTAAAGRARTTIPACAGRAGWPVAAVAIVARTNDQPGANAVGGRTWTGFSTSTTPAPRARQRRRPGPPTTSYAAKGNAPRQIVPSRHVGVGVDHADVDLDQVLAAVNPQGRLARSAVLGDLDQPALGNTGVAPPQIAQRPSRTICGVRS